MTEEGDLFHNGPKFLIPKRYGNWGRDFAEKVAFHDDDCCIVDHEVVLEELARMIEEEKQANV